MESFSLLALLLSLHILFSLSQKWARQKFQQINSGSLFYFIICKIKKIYIYIVFVHSETKYHLYFFSFFLSVMSPCSLLFLQLPPLFYTFIYTTSLYWPPNISSTYSFFHHAHRPISAFESRLVYPLVSVIFMSTVPLKYLQ